MSYGFNIRAATLAAAAAAVGAELDKVEAAQPIHGPDLCITEGAVRNLLSLTAEPAEGNEISVSVSGSCTGTEGQPFTGCGFSISISSVPKTE